MRGLLSSFNTREKSITLKWEGQWLLSWGSFSFFLLREHDLFVQFVLLTFKIAAHALQRLTAVALPGAGGGFRPLIFQFNLIMNQQLQSCMPTPFRYKCAACPPPPSAKITTLSQNRLKPTSMNLGHTLEINPTCCLHATLFYSSNTLTDTAQPSLLIKCQAGPAFYS